MSNTTYHKDDIVEINNFISKKESELIIKYFDSQPQKWMVFNDSFAECYGMPLSFNDKGLESNGLEKNIFETINNRFKDIVEKTFNKKFNGVTYHAQKWDVGGMVDVHSDISDIDGNLNKNSTNKYTVILYLNDDYEGGELFFPQHNIVIKPSAGSIVTFPGDHTNIHGVNEVKNKTRYTIVSWWDDTIKETKEEKSDDDLYINEKLFYYKNIIKNPQDVVDKIDSSKEPWIFYPTKETNGHQIHELNTYEFTEYKKFDISDIQDVLKDCINNYEIKNNIKIKRFTDMIIHKSYPGKHLGPHTDSSGEHSSPYITVIITLNDNYSGGEMIFDKQNLTLKLSAGSVLIYPSVEPYSHLPSLITAGSKISAIMFGFKDEDN
jgi:predicted 2-oxoglutarate/Fe(II)-dependent dioxygenase YbiX